MAFDYFSQNQQEDQNGQPQSLGAESQVVTGNDASKGGNGGTASGSFTNLQNYLNANAPNKFGQQVAGKVEGLVDDASKAQAETQTGFQGKVDQGSVKEDSGLTQRAVSDPNSVAGNEADLASFAKQRDAKYQGPNDLTEDPENYTKAEGATNTAFSTADQTKSESGRKAYLANEYGTKAGRFDYSSGMQNLDNLLIQNDPEAQKAFSDVNQKANTVRDQFGTLQSTLNDYAKQAAAQTAAARNNTRSALGIDDAGNYQQGQGALGKEEGTLDANVAARKKALADEQAMYQGNQGRTNLNQIDPALLARMGVDPSQYGAINFGVSGPIVGMDAEAGWTGGVDAGKFNQFTPEGDITRNTANSPEELARMQALTKLAGLDNTFVPSSGASQAGQYAQGNFAHYNAADLASMSGAQRAGFQSAMGALAARVKETLGHTGGGSTSSGQIDPTVLQTEVNNIRQQYGLPRVGKDNYVAPREALPGQGFAPGSMGGIRF